MKKMAVLLILAMLFCSVAPTHAANFVSRSQMIAYLDDLMLEVPGTEVSITVPVSELTTEQLDGMIEYIGRYGRATFEALLINNSKFRRSAEQDSRSSDEYRVSLAEGWTEDWYGVYELVDWYHPETGAWMARHEYLAGFEFAIEVSNGMIVDATLDGFDLEIPEYLSGNLISNEVGYSSMVATFDANYDLTWTIEHIEVGEPPLYWQVSMLMNSTLYVRNN